MTSHTPTANPDCATCNGTGLVPATIDSTVDCHCTGTPSGAP